MATASAMLAVARSQIGYKEGSKKDDTIYGKWFGMNYTWWCDMFVSWCAWKSGNQKVVGKSARCSDHMAWFKKKKRFGSRPRPGAIVFYSLGGKRCDHVGIVMSVDSDRSILAIEGNTNPKPGRDPNMVAVMHRAGKKILGYGYPAYDAAPPLPSPKPGTPAPKPPAKPKFPGAKYFGVGKVNQHVTLLGKMLIARGGKKFYKVGAGPKFTAVDKNACAAFQRAQGWSGGDADGIPGPVTWDYLVNGKGKNIK